MDVREVVACELCGDLTPEDRDVADATGLHLCAACVARHADADKRLTKKLDRSVVPRRARG